jgi:hypothetical protein
MDPITFEDKKRVAHAWVFQISYFSRWVIERPLYRYQLEPAQAIVDSVLRKKGLEFAVMFPRQSGKNETRRTSRPSCLTFNARGSWIVKAADLLPQAINAMFRLEGASNIQRAEAQARGLHLPAGQATMAFPPSRMPTSWRTRHGLANATRRKTPEPKGQGFPP